MKLTEKQLSREPVFSGSILKLYLDTVELENGKKASREIVEHTGGVCILPIDDDFNVYMVRQFRYPFAEVMLELPAGKLNKDEDPLDCAKRELLEETGLVATEFVSLGTLYPTPAYCTEITHIYMAKGLTQHEQNLDEDEFIEVECISLETLVKEVLRGNIQDAKTQIGILKAKFLKELAK